MNLLHLKYFKTVAELEHITKAADKLFISQPSLSKSLHQFEEEVGVPLFDREGKGIRLNQNGKILLEHITKALDEIDYGLAEIKDKNHQYREVSLSVTAATQFLPEIILGFQSTYPNTEMYINQDKPNTKEPKSDLYLYSSNIPVDGENITPLLAEECYIGMSVNNPLTSYDVISPAMLKDEHFLTMQNHLPLYKLTYELCENAGFTPISHLQFDNRETIFALISTGMGVALIPSKTWAPYINDENICLKPLSVSCERYIILQANSKHYFSESMRQMSNYLINFFENL